MLNNNAVIVDLCRTPIGKFGGTLKPFNADVLAAEIMKGVFDRTGLPMDTVDEVMFGHCRQTSDFSNTARYAALKAGIPEFVPANTIMYACASSMLAMNNAVNSIITGQNSVVLAGGTESMTNAFFYLSNARWGVGTGTTALKDSLTEAQFNSQPQDIYGTVNMGHTAENVAKKYNISRTDQDAFSLLSQQKALAAIKSGRFTDEIVSLTIPQKKKPSVIFDTDEFPRETSLELLANLRPAFIENGCVTAGNSSGRNDGAAAALIMSREKAAELGQKPIARIVGMACAGVDPRYMGLGPVAATKKVLMHTGLTLDDIELIELNEAFASQSLACIRLLGLEDKMDYINVNGGAISLGHPIGASGCRIVVTLLHEMRKRGMRYGLATLCAAGGLGMSAIIEALYD